MDKKSIIIVVLVALLGLVVGGAGVYFYNNLGSDSDEFENDNKNIELSTKEINDLMEVVNDLQFVDIMNKKSVAIGEKLDNQELLDFAFRKLAESDDSLYLDNYSLNDVNNLVNKYFGYNIKPENYKCFMGHDQYIYNDVNKSFDANPDCAHGLDIMKVYNLYDSSSKEGEIYTIKVKKVFTNWDDLGLFESYFASFDDADNFENKLFNIDIDEKVDVIEEAKKYESKLNVYTYTFEKINNNYVLRTYEH